jgi:hypothetical protein
MQLLNKRRLMRRIKPHVRELVEVIEAILLQEAASLIEQIEAYGVVVRQGFTTEQLRQILAAIERIASRLQQIAGGCGLEIDTPQALFRSMFGDTSSETYLDFRSNADAEFASVDDNTLDFAQIVTLAPNTFTSPSDNEPYRDDIVQGIIIHELGHAFHNRLKQVYGTDYEFTSPDAVQVIANRDTNGNLRSYTVTIARVTVGGQEYTDLRITVSPDTPLVVVDYLVETGGYWAGNIGFEEGTSRPQGRYTAADAQTDGSIVMLTNTLYEAAVGPVRCECGARTVFLVDMQGNCLRDGGGNCIPPSAANTTPDAAYVREPGTYIVNFNVPNGYDESGLEQAFSNELGETTLTSQPIEGFADVFKVIITEFEVPENFSRTEFFERNWCRWLVQLLGSGGGNS